MSEDTTRSGLSSSCGHTFPHSGVPQTPPRHRQHPKSTSQSPKAPRPLPRKKPGKRKEEEASPPPKLSTQESMETGGAILLQNVQGTKYDGGEAVNTLSGPGELLVECFRESQYHNYQLHEDHSIYLHCEAKDIGTLGPEEFLLLEAIKNRGDRLKIFRHKLEWGVSLREGSKVRVVIPGGLSSLVNHQARAIIRYKGKVANNSGMLFGVEITEQSQRAARVGITDSDGTFQGRRYFTCDEGSGLFVTLEEISFINSAQQVGTAYELQAESTLGNIEVDRDDYTHATSPYGRRRAHNLNERDIYLQRQRRKLVYDEVEPVVPPRTSPTRGSEGEASHVSYSTSHKTETRFPLPYENLSSQEWHLANEELLNDMSPSSAANQSSDQSLQDLQISYAYLRRQNERLQTEEKRFIELDHEHQAQIKELKAQLQKEQATVKEYSDIIHKKEEEIRKKNEKIAALQQQQQQRSVQFDSEELPSSNTEETWKVPRKKIKNIPKKEIGFGSWGSVYAANFQGEDVAIKIAHKAIFHESTVDMLKREVTIMSHIQHPNLVRFIAAVWDDAVERKVDTPIIISELMDMNLRVAYTEKNLSSSLTSIFCDVAYALHHLHCLRIIHRDISAPNILLKFAAKGSIRAKVSDFGSANLEKLSKTAGAGAILYSAPEMFPREGINSPSQPYKQTSKVDVYSFGILLLEVISKEIPSQETSHTMMQKIKRQWKLMYDLIEHCTQTSPNDRPNMYNIINRLNKFA